MIGKSEHEWISLPLKRTRHRNDADHLANSINAKQVSRMLKGPMDAAFLGFIQPLHEGVQAMEEPGESSTIVKPKWDATLPDFIRTVLD